MKPVGGPASDGKACHTQIEAKSDSARPLQGLSKAKERRRGLFEVRRATAKPMCVHKLPEYPRIFPISNRY